MTALTADVELRRDDLDDLRQPELQARRGMRAARDAGVHQLPRRTRAGHRRERRGDAGAEPERLLLVLAAQQDLHV